MKTIKLNRKMQNLGPVHTNPFSKRFASTLIVFVSFSPVHTKAPIKREVTWQHLSTILDTLGRVVWRPVVSIFDDVTVFSPSTQENIVFKKHRFQIAPLWRAFSNGSVFGDHFRRCSVDDSRIRSRTAPFSFDHGLVWRGVLGHFLLHFDG